jgi:hypothetical protein
MVIIWSGFVRSERCTIPSTSWVLWADGNSEGHIIRFDRCQMASTCSTMYSLLFSIHVRLGIAC